MSGDAERRDVLLRGDLDLSNAHELRDALQQCAAMHTRLVVIDLAGVDFLAVVGLHVFIDAQNVFDRYEARLVLTRVRPFALRILRLADLYDLVAEDVHTE